MDTMFTVHDISVRNVRVFKMASVFQQNGCHVTGCLILCAANGR